MLGKFKERCNNPEKAEFVDKLERTLNSHAFNDMIEVEEESLLSALDINRNGLIKALNVLMQNDHILVFTVIDSRDLIRVLEPRSARLPVNKESVEKHRDVMLAKLEKMNFFINSDTCREVFLRNYFGDSGNKACGHCDNCLKKTTEISKGILDEELIENTLAILSSGDASVNKIAKELLVSQEKVRELIAYLIKENIIEVSKNEIDRYSLIHSR